MSKPLSPDVLAAHGADPDDLLVAVGAQLWEPKAVERYKRSQIWSHPSAILSYYVGLGFWYQAVRACLSLPVFVAAVVGTSIAAAFIAEACGGGPTITAVVPWVVAVTGSIISSMVYVGTLTPVFAWRWETHQISLEGNGVGYHTKTALQSRFDRTSGIPNFAKDLMRSVQVLFPDATFTLQIFGPDPILTVHLASGRSRTILVWDGDKIISPR